MKRIVFAVIAVTGFTFMACNSGDKTPKQDDMSKINADSSKKITADSTQMKEVTPTFSNIDPKLATSLKTVVDHYLHIKNALVNNSGSDAADGSKAMANAISKVDKSFFTAEQK